MSKHNEKSIKQAINEAFDNLQMSRRISETRILNAWEKMMGKVIAKHTKRMYISKGVLFLYLDNPALKNELLYSRQQMITLLNEEAGEELIKEIVIK